MIYDMNYKKADKMSPKRETLFFLLLFFLSFVFGVLAQDETVPTNARLQFRPIGGTSRLVQRQNFTTLNESPPLVSTAQKFKQIAAERRRWRHQSDVALNEISSTRPYPVFDRSATIKNRANNSVSHLTTTTATTTTTTSPTTTATTITTTLATTITSPTTTTTDTTTEMPVSETVYSVDSDSLDSVASGDLDRVVSGDQDSEATEHIDSVASDNLYSVVSGDGGSVASDNAESPQTESPNETTTELLTLPKTTKTMLSTPGEDTNTESLTTTEVPATDSSFTESTIQNVATESSLVPSLMHSDLNLPADLDEATTLEPTILITDWSFDTTILTNEEQSVNEDEILQFKVINDENERSENLKEYPIRGKSQLLSAENLVRDRKEETDELQLEVSWQPKNEESTLQDDNEMLVKVHVSDNVEAVRLRYLHMNASNEELSSSTPHYLSDRMQEAEIVLVPMDASSHDGQVILRQLELQGWYILCGEALNQFSVLDSKCLRTQINQTQNLEKLTSEQTTSSTSTNANHTGQLTLSSLIIIGVVVGVVVIVTILIGFFTYRTISARRERKRRDDSLRLRVERKAQRERELAAKEQWAFNAVYADPDSPYEERCIM